MIEKLPLVTREIAKSRKPTHLQYRFFVFRLPEANIFTVG